MHVCPACGYCPNCGRSDSPGRPRDRKPRPSNPWRPIDRPYVIPQPPNVVPVNPSIPGVTWPYLGGPTYIWHDPPPTSVWNQTTTNE